MNVYYLSVRERHSSCCYSAKEQEMCDDDDVPAMCQRSVMNLLSIVRVKSRSHMSEVSLVH